MNDRQSTRFVHHCIRDNSSMKKAIEDLDLSTLELLGRLCGCYHARSRQILINHILDFKSYSVVPIPPQFSDWGQFREHLIKLHSDSSKLTQLADLARIFGSSSRGRKQQILARIIDDLRKPIPVHSTAKVIPPQPSHLAQPMLTKAPQLPSQQKPHAPFSIPHHSFPPVNIESGYDMFPQDQDHMFQSQRNLQLYNKSGDLSNLQSIPQQQQQHQQFRQQQEKSLGPEFSSSMYANFNDKNFTVPTAAVLNVNNKTSNNKKKKNNNKDNNNNNENLTTNDDSIYYLPSMRINPPNQAMPCSSEPYLNIPTHADVAFSVQNDESLSNHFNAQFHADSSVPPMKNPKKRPYFDSSIQKHSLVPIQVTKRMNFGPQVKSNGKAYSNDGVLMDSRCIDILAAFNPMKPENPFYIPISGPLTNDDASFYTVFNTSRFEKKGANAPKVSFFYSPDLHKRSKDANIQVHLRCYSFDPKKPPGQPCEPFYPFPSVLLVNNLQVNVQQAQRYTNGKLAGKDTSTNIVSVLKPNKVNVVEMHRLKTGGNTLGAGYFFMFVQAVEAKTPSQLVEAIRANTSEIFNKKKLTLKNSEDTEYTQREIELKEAIQEMNQGGIQVENVRISLQCAISLGRIAIPIRGIHCKHLQCFDLLNYLEFAKKSLKFDCPVCGLPDYTHIPDKLMISELFQDFLKKAPEQDEFLEFLADGTIRTETDIKKAKAQSTVKVISGLKKERFVAKAEDEHTKADGDRELVDVFDNMSNDKDSQIVDLTFSEDEKCLNDANENGNPSHSSVPYNNDASSINPFLDGESNLAIDSLDVNTRSYQGQQIQDDDDVVSISD